MRLRFLVKVEEHDHIKEEHHNSTRVYNDMDHRGELRVHENVMSRDAKECNDQVEDAMNGIARQYDHDGRKDREE